MKPSTLMAARRLLLHAKPGPGRAPYDLELRCGSARVLVAARPLNGRAGVSVKESQHRALTALGSAAYYVCGVLVPLDSLVGVAHLHAHRLNASERHVVFRVQNGQPQTPRWCFGRCEGPL